MKTGSARGSPSQKTLFSLIFIIECAARAARRNNMYIAVTGAGGMLGRHAVADLFQAGHQVRALDRTMPPTWDTEFRRAEMRDLGQVCGAFHGCDAVLHLAAIPTLTGHSYDEVFSTNVLSTYNV